MRVSTAKKTIKKPTLLRIYKNEITTLSPSNCYYYYQPTNKQAKIMKSNHHHLHIAKNTYERRASTTKASTLNSTSCRIEKFCRTLIRQHRYQLDQHRLHVSSELPSLSSKLRCTLTLTAASRKIHLFHRAAVIPNKVKCKLSSLSTVKSITAI